ncbi:MAG TPA: Fic family protein [Chloroflexia bacterium]|nr:Fic family protein [Chloroflexia bacterium]
MQIASYHVQAGLESWLAANEAEWARLRGAQAFTRPGVAAVNQRLRQEFIYHSARLQGNPLTLDDIVPLLARRPPPGALSLPQQEVVNLNVGLGYIEMLAGGDMPLTERLFRVLHAVVMRGLMPAGVEVGSYRTDDLAQLGYPVPAASEVISEMGAFGRWLTQKPDSPEYLASPILRAAYAHTRLLTIHPFLNGNGRTARLLLNLIFLRAGYPLVALDSRQKDAYLTGLHEASTHNDMTLILGMVLDAVERALAAYAVVSDQ